MSRILYLNCASGLSGDMTVAALLAVGADLGRMREMVAALDLGPIELHTEDVRKGGLSAVRFMPRIPGGTPRQKTLNDVNAILEKNTLPREIAALVGDVFLKLARAEADVHGEPPDAVHFHELGDPDTIVDVVSAVTGIVSLGIEKTYASPVNVGAGTVRMAHGAWPVPAPATANLLSGGRFEICSDGEQGEKTTPTGAALLAALAGPSREMPPLTIARVGYGAGTADFSRSVNVLQAMLGETSSDAENRSVVLECNIDDMNPQVYPYLINRLLGAGAQDAYLTPCLMKKGRPGFVVTVVASPDLGDLLAGILLAESTSIGLRRYPVERQKAGRRIESIESPWGRIAVKVITVGERVRAVPEFEDCRKAAESSGRPLLEIMSALGRIAAESFGE